MNEWDSVEDLIDMIGGESIDNYDQMVQLPTVEILARMIYQENHHVGDQQNRIVFSVVNRICLQGGYVHQVENQEKKVNNLYGIVTSNKQYESIWNAKDAKEKTEAGKYNAYWVPNDENAVESEKIAWENAKRLAALLYYAVEEYGDGEDTERGKCVGKDNKLEVRQNIINFLENQKDSQGNAIINTVGEETDFGAGENGENVFGH